MALATVPESHQLMYFQNGRYKFFAGTSVEIIDAGLARADQFPGAPGRGKTAATYYDGELVRPGSHHPKDEKYLSIRRAGKNKFDVMVGYVADELTEWLEARDRAVQRRIKEESYAAAKKTADLELAYLAQTKEQFIAQQRAQFHGLIDLTISHLGPSEYRGFSFSAKTLNEIRIAAMGMYAALQGGEVVFNKKTHDAREKAIYAELAKFEPGRPALRLVQAT